MNIDASSVTPCGTLHLFLVFEIKVECSSFLSSTSAQRVYEVTRIIETTCELDEIHASCISRSNVRFTTYLIYKKAREYKSISKRAFSE